MIDPYSFTSSRLISLGPCVNISCYRRK